MTQRELINILQENNLILNQITFKEMKEDVVTDITYNSKECKKGSAFFVKGLNFKEEYIKDSEDRGATLVISEEMYNLSKAGMIVVTDIRRAMAVIAIEFFNHSYKSFNLIGLTGTKGKTTTTYFISNILEEYLKKRPALISTVAVYTGARDEEAHLTTPEAIELQRYFQEIKQSDINFCTMEVTSQAYKKDRVYGMSFNTGVFLNIAEDHISDAEHPNFEDYLSCKLQFISACQNVVINRETDYYDAVVSASKNAKKIITYSANKYTTDVDYYVDKVEKEGTIFSFVVHKLENNKEVYNSTFQISMQGRFNIENALAAIVVAKIYNVDDESIKRGLLKTQVWGRMNVIENDDITVIVDYAHNKLSFTKFFESVVLDYPNRRIVTVAGGPGGKAYARRKDLGQIAGKYSDYMYLTAEDPQFESVESICKDIQSYVECESVIIPDRKTAVETAILKAKKGDVIALLAKGEEDYQKVNGIFTPYESDLKIAQRLMKK